MKKIVLYVSVLVLLSFGVQNKETEHFLRDMQQCAGQAKTEKETNLDLSYKVYHSHVSNITAETAKGKFCKKGNDAYYNLMGTTLIQHKDMMVVVDDSSKRVLVQKAGDLFDPVSQQMDLNHVKAFAKNITAKQENEHRVYYKIEVKDGEVQSVGVLVDQKKQRIEKIELFYAHQTEIIEKSGTKIKVLPRLEIVYAPAAHKTPENVFDTGKIIQKTKKGFSLTPAYRNYRLIDQYHNKTR